MAFAGIHHIVIRVRDREEAIETYRGLGLEVSETREHPAIGKMAIIRLADGFFLELVAPLSDDSPIARAIESRGEGVHSVALSVEDFDASVEQLTAAGAPLILQPGLDGIAFINPKSAHGAMLQVMEQGR